MGNAGFYVVSVRRNSTVSGDQKALWTVLLLLGHFVVFPFYWYTHIWKEAEEVSAGVEETYGHCATRHMTSEGITKPTAFVKIALLVSGALPAILGLVAVLVRMFTNATDIAVYGLGVSSFILLLTVVVFYLVNVYSNRAVNRDQRVLWAVLLFLGNVVVFPFYWYLHVWRSPKQLVRRERAHPS